MDEIVINFNKRVKTETLQSIETAIEVWRNADDESGREKCIAVLEAIRVAITKGDKFIIPVELPQDFIDSIDPENLRAGDDFDIPDDLHLRFRTVQLKDETVDFAAFTSQDELMEGTATSSITEDIDVFMEKVLKNPDMDGFILNPWHNSFYVSKDYIRMIFSGNLPADRENIVHFGTADITQVEVACIVNAANKSLLGGGGVDGAIHKAAGPELLEECRTLNGCETGEAKITKGYNLKADYIIHTVGPRYSGYPEDAKLLRNCYWNSLELARHCGIHSIAFPAISTGIYGYPLKEATEIALKTVSDWLKINPKHGMAIMFACYDDKTTELYKSIWAENEAAWNERPIIRENNGDLERAMQFAMDAHKGAVRKGTNKPYILHPIETLQILASMDADTNLMVAGLLHDTLEDTDVTLLDIYEQFGVDVAALVNAHTEDKRQIWYMRKLHTIDEVPKAILRQKMLVIADKVANLRSMYADYKVLGDELWSRFNAPKHLQAWYYSKLNDGLYELQDYPETADVYWEMTALYKDLFVNFYVDDNKGVLYQIGADGESHVLKKGKPQWNELEGSVPKKARSVTRKEAERIEDNWAEPFWAVHELDLSDAIIEVYKNETKYLFVEIKNGEILFRGEMTETSDSGEQLREIAYSMDGDNTHRFLVQLRLKNGTRNKLSTVFKKEFGTEDGIENFIAFCKDHVVQFAALRI